MVEKLKLSYFYVYYMTKNGLFAIESSNNE